MATITSPRAQSPAGNTSRIKSPSIAETPTSSTRGSFDFNNRPAPPSSNVGPQRRGNRTALRDYYNLKNKPQQPGAGQLSRTASITSTTSDVSTAASVSTTTENVGTTASALTAQLDNQDFDAQTYISDLLSTSSLCDILKVEATLVSEIRNLDGERKSLVYDNYSKLIKAVGTIGEMQRGMNKSGGGLSEVGELEAKMEGLRTTVREIASTNTDIQKQEAQRARQQRRDGKEAQKQKDLVKWILGAPARLQRLMDEGKAADAEKEWDIVQEHLDKWAGVKGVEEVRTACEDAMATSSDEEAGRGND